MLLLLLHGQLIPLLDLADKKAIAFLLPLILSLSSSSKIFFQSLLLFVLLLSFLHMFVPGVHVLRWLATTVSDFMAALTYYRKMERERRREKGEREGGRKEREREVRAKEGAGSKLNWQEFYKR